MAKPFAYVSSQNGIWNGVISPDLPWDESEDWWQDAITRGLTIHTVSSREEYNQLLTSLGVKGLV